MINLVSEGKYEGSEVISKLGLKGATLSILFSWKRGKEKHVARE